MWRSLLLTGLQAAWVALPGPAHAQSSKSKKDAAERASEDDYARLRKLSQVSGKIVDLDTRAGSLTLRVPLPTVEENPNYKPPQLGGNQAALNLQRQMASLTIRYRQAMRNPNPRYRNQQVVRIARDKQRLKQQAARALNNPNSQPLRVVSKPKDFELSFGDEVVVRKMFVGTEYDDLGYLKEYTPSQLAALRGNGSRPGYAAKLEDVQIGQEVALTLGRAGESNRPPVRMIVMTRETSSFSSSK